MAQVIGLRSKLQFTMFDNRGFVVLFIFYVVYGRFRSNFVVRDPKKKARFDCFSINVLHILVRKTGYHVRSKGVSDFVHFGHFMLDYAFSLQGF